MSGKTVSLGLSYPCPSENIDQNRMRIKICKWGYVYINKTIKNLVKKQDIKKEAPILQR